MKQLLWVFLLLCACRENVALAPNVIIARGEAHIATRIGPTAQFRAVVGRVIPSTDGAACGEVRYANRDGFLTPYERFISTPDASVEMIEDGSNSYMLGQYNLFEIAWERFCKGTPN